MLKAATVAGQRPLCFDGLDVHSMSALELPKAELHAAHDLIDLPVVDKACRTAGGAVAALVAGRNVLAALRLHFRRKGGIAHPAQIDGVVHENSLVRGWEGKPSGQIIMP